MFNLIWTRNRQFSILEVLDNFNYVTTLQGELHCSKSQCMLLSSNIRKMFVFRRKKLSGAVNLNSSPLHQGCWCWEASRVLGIDFARNFSSRMFDKIKSFWLPHLVQSIGYWSEIHNVFFHFCWSKQLNLVNNAFHYCSQKSRKAFMVQETNQTIWSMNITSRFSWVVSNCRCF